MELISQIRNKACSLGKHIVLPEGTEPRTQQAAVILSQENLATITLLGDIEQIKATASENNVNLDGINIIDPSSSDLFDDFSKTFFTLREKKGMTMEKAVETMKNPLYFGTMMVYKDICHGMVAGAENATSDVLRPALQIIKTKPGVTTVSGAFIMISPKTEYGDNGRFIFTDCAVNPDPTAEQLAEYAYCSAQTAIDIADIKDPKVAMLSFSTMGSAKHEMADKVVDAVQIAKEKYPDLKLDGEMQLDAAIVPSVGKSKAPNSSVAGQANVLVFPDLQSGNICYKAVQRFGDADAIGPILQGIAKPVNDLSRGCSVEDIVNTVSVVCCQQ